MPALDLYLAPNSEYSYTSFLTTLVIIVFVGLTQMKMHLMYAGDLERYSIAFEKRISALEGVVKEFSATETAHEALLKEHGEDISLASETAYRAAGLPDTNKPHPRERLTPFDARVQYTLDEPIQNFLRTSPKRTAREVLSHLGAAVALKSRPTLHDVNSRLYSLLAQRKIKKDNSARPVWSVV